MLSRTLLLIPLAIGAFPLHGQEFRETVEVRVAEVEVVVTDSKGNPITGLTPSDFTLLVDGREQPITNFQEVRSSVSVPASPDSAARTPQATTPSKVVAIFLDPLSMRTRDRDRLYASLREMVEKVGPGATFYLSHWDRGGMITVGPTTDAAGIQRMITAAEKSDRAPEESSGMDRNVEFIREADRFAAEAGSRMGRGSSQAPVQTVPVEIREGEFEKQTSWTRDSCAENFLKEMSRKSSSMIGLVDAMALMDGRKALIYLSSRFPQNTETYCMASSSLSSWSKNADSKFDTRDFLLDVEKAANAAGVTFYAIRPEQQRNELQLERSVSQSIYEFDLPAVDANDQIGYLNETGALSSLTDPTGGLLGTGPKAADLYSKIVSDLGNYYSIGFRLESGEAGVPIDVKARGRYDVRLRKTIASASSERRVRQDLKAALFVPSGTGDIPFSLRRLEARPGSAGRLSVPLEVSIPMGALTYQDSDGRQLARLRVLSVERSGGAEGGIGEIAEQQLEIQKPPDVPGVSPSFVVKLSAEPDPAGKIVAVSVVDLATGARATRREWIAPRDPDPSVPAWKTMADISHDSRRPLFLYVRPETCGAACAQVDAIVAAQDARPTGVLFSKIAPGELPASLGWPENQAGLVLLRADGDPIVSFKAIPNPLTNTVDVISRLGPVIAQSSMLARKGETGEADLLSGAVAMDLGATPQAIEHLEKVRSSAGSGSLADRAAIRLAYLSSNDPMERIQAVESLAGQIRDREAKAEAWLTVATLRSAQGDAKGTRAALQAAMKAAPRNSPMREKARALLDQM